jgi:hypothetical protein
MSSIWANNAVGVGHGKGRLNSAQAWSAWYNQVGEWLQIDAGDGNWEADARATAGLLAARGFDWLVVDHYALGRPWEQALRPHVGKLLAIDDLGRAHDCDVLLDQNYLCLCNKIFHFLYSQQASYQDFHLRVFRLPHIKTKTFPGFQ